MNRQEALKILSILKAAYPNSYKDMSKEEASGTANIWAAQFANIPYEIITIATNKIISTNIFPPSISEVKEKIRGLYYEAMEELPYQHGGLYPSNTNEIDPRKLMLLKKIIEVTEPMRTRQQIEPSLSDMLSQYENRLTNGRTETIKSGTLLAKNSDYNGEGV